MSLLSPTLPPSATAVTTRHSGLCPFHDGAATLDLLLAELDSRETPLFDAVLDLRSLAAGRDAAACIEQLFRVRTLLAGRHYLAFYRVRCWARRTFRIEVLAQRGDAALVREFPLDGGRLDEVVNSSLAALVRDHGEIPASAHVRFTFNSATA
jgi:hypothetical protein